MPAMEVVRTSQGLIARWLNPCGVPLRAISARWSNRRRCERSEPCQQCERSELGQQRAQSEPSQQQEQREQCEPWEARHVEDSARPSPVRRTGLPGRTLFLALGILVGGLGGLGLSCGGSSGPEGGADPAGTPSDARGTPRSASSDPNGRANGQGTGGAPGASNTAPTSPSTNARANTQAPSNTPSRPNTQAPARVFRDTRVVREPWFLALQGLVEPPQDTWPTEALAWQVEAVWRDLWLAPDIDLDAAESPWLWRPGLQAQSACLPTDWEQSSAAPSGSVHTGTEFGVWGAVEAEVWGSHRAHLLALAPDRSNRQVEVQVRSINLLPTPEAPSVSAGKRSYELEVWIRLSDGRASYEWDSRQVWRVNKPGTQIALASLRWVRCRVARAEAPWFQDQTPALLPGARLPQSLLRAGGVETVERHDRLIPISTMYLGMHGVAVGDVNGDGHEDLYWARPGGEPNQLLIRQPDGRLLDRARSAGVADLEDTGGVLICDLDGDGARDLIAGLRSQLVIAWNDGQGRFAQRTVLDGGAEASQIYSITAADADGDGDLDLYDTRYFDGSRLGSAPTPYHDAENGARNFFWRNGGKRAFREATAEVGLDTNNTRFSLASLWEDLDGDGDLDLYVTNDFGRNNYYRNDGGQFVDVAETRGALDIAASMGVSAGDANRDGRIDLYVSNMHTAAGMRVVADPTEFSTGMTE